MTQEAAAAETTHELELNIPVVQLYGATVNVVPHPGDPDGRMLMVGPLVLALPLSGDAARALAGEISGSKVAVAPADVLHRLRRRPL